MSGLIQDLRYAFRTLAKSPGFTAVAVLSLALGIGANTAIFSLVDALLLDMLRVRQPQELALFGPDQSSGVATGNNRDTNLFSYPLFERFREENQDFSDVFAFASRVPYVRESTSGSYSPGIRLVSGNFFSVLGVDAALGRVITPHDNRVPGGHPVIVISHNYWKRRFDQLPDAIGKTLTLNDTVYEVIGVAPPGFYGLTMGWDLDGWIPIMMQAQVMRQESWLAEADTRWLRMMGRPRPGVTFEQAAASSAQLLHRIFIEERGPGIAPDKQRELERVAIEVLPGGRGLSVLRSQYAQPLLVLMTVVGLILLIACANVANLLLARASARMQEIGVRLSLGAGRMRMMRQLLTESLVLASFGGAAGFLVAVWGRQLLLGLVFVGWSSIPLDLEIDTRVLGFTALASLLTGLLFGLVPALRASRLDVLPILKGAGQGGQISGRGHVSRFLVVSQVAVALVLSVGAGLFLRTLQNMKTFDVGFRPEHVLQVSIDPRTAGYGESEWLSLYEQLLARVEAIPGVVSASLTGSGLFGGASSASSISVEGYQARPDERVGSRISYVSPGYLKTVGNTLLLGRGLTDRDREGAPKVALVNEEMARRFFPNDSALGKRFGFGAPEDGYDYQIVGVVKDAHYQNIREQMRSMIYVSLYQMPWNADALEIRAAGEAKALSSQVREAIKSVSPNMPVRSVTTLAERIDDSLHQEKLLTKLTSFFGVLALVLAAIGLYGIMGYAVSRRTREIGLRMALGAQRHDVVRAVLRETLLLVAVGAALGIPLTIACGRFVAGLLFGITPADPLTIATAVLVLLLTGVLAASLPARRATKIDPMTALRYE
jgi:predicted permease